MEILISVLSVILVGAVVTVTVFIANLTIQMRATAAAVEEAAKTLTSATKRLEQSIDLVDDAARSYSLLAKTVEARVESTRELFDTVDAVTKAAKTGWLNIARFALGFVTNLKRQ